ncbi:hypothetical protein [Schumannella sp. 10F1B-5-1]|nr:hypothetical protein [Schumannella sp. 10F1B-5-1]
MSDPKGDGPQKPSMTRILVWVGVAAVAVWLIISGISGMIARGDF